MVVGADRVWCVRLEGRTRWRIVPGDAADRVAALTVRRDVYRQARGRDWNARGDDVDRRAELCVIRTADDRPVGSLRLNGPDDRPFDLDAYVPVDRALPPAARPAEMSRLAVLPAFRPMTSGVLLAAFAFTFQRALAERWTHFVLMSLDDTMAMWRWLLFEPTGLSFVHPGFDGRRVDVLALALDDVIARYRKARHALAPLLVRAQDAAAG